MTPPPGPGVETVTGNMPPTEMSPAGITAVNWPLFTNVVVRLLPFQRTTELLMKFDPLTVKVNCGPPAPAVVGKMLFSVGAGLLTVNVCEFDVPPPGAGLKTVTVTVPAVATSLAGIVAVS